VPITMYRTSDSCERIYFEMPSDLEAEGAVFALIFRHDDCSIDLNISTYYTRALGYELRVWQDRPLSFCRERRAELRNSVELYCSPRGTAAMWNLYADCKSRFARFGWPEFHEGAWRRTPPLSVLRALLLRPLVKLAGRAISQSHQRCASHRSLRAVA